MSDTRTTAARGKTTACDPGVEVQIINFLTNWHTHATWRQPPKQDVNRREGLEPRLPTTLDRKSFFYGTQQEVWLHFPPNLQQTICKHGRTLGSRSIGSQCNNPTIQINHAGGVALYTAHAQPEVECGRWLDSVKRVLHSVWIRKQVYYYHWYCERLCQVVQVLRS